MEDQDLKEQNKTELDASSEEQREEEEDETLDKEEKKKTEYRQLQPNFMK
jgi:hypothetical protein